MSVAMAGRTRGLYEQLITAAMATELQQLDARLVASRDDLSAAEAPDRLALHLGRVLRQAIEALDPDQRVPAGLVLARGVLAAAEQQTHDAALQFEVPIGTVLRSLRALQPDGEPEVIPVPLIPLLDTTLLTNSPGEPRVGSQVLAEIHSADAIDVVMAFIRYSGIAPMLAALSKHCAAGRSLRVLTTTYTGSTESRALDELQRLGAEVRVSYDTSTTRLHAKAWLFHRASGFSTAYIGSSNLTHSAQVSGLEWNVRVSGARNPDVIDKVAAVFGGYWASDDFPPYEREAFERAVGGETRGPGSVLSPVEVRPEPFQQRLLEQIAMARVAGRHRNLLVAATGTGKTVMAAIDYARLRAEMPRARLLFVAHRVEILEQSLATFRHALRDAAFGELWVGGARPRQFEHVFASIASLHASDLANLDQHHFDVIIVDEFHHAAAASYVRVLEHLQPVELLGLTATPERSDGLPVLDWFGGRIAAELRLWDAIDQHRLVPFAWFGVHDGVDLRDVPWRRGRGYDVDGLSRVLTADTAIAHRVIAQLERRVPDLRRMRALGFCVSVEHARFLARVFTAAGIAALAVWADSPPAERAQVLRDLRDRRVQVVFSVDLFNEGVDVPAVDTLLLLRPTESGTLFLQQLGRGLRRCEGKSVCTVLDFVGQHRREFRFDRRLGALLGGTRRELAEQVRSGFPYLPAGCHMELDAVASEIVLRSLREAVATRWKDMVAELHAMAAGGRPVQLAEYLAASGLDLGDVYAGNRGWSDLCTDAGLPLLAAGPHEQKLRRACGRLLHVDDRVRIDAYRGLLAATGAPDVEALPERERRLLRMLIASMLDQVVDKAASLASGCALLWQHPQVCRELVELLDVLADRLTHLHAPLVSHPESPLQVHARYTRIEMLAAFGAERTARTGEWREGVRWLRDAKVDLFAFTLDKETGHFSPTTRYRDYAISRDLVHWESQSTTTAASESGQRYQNHVVQGSSVLLFARQTVADRAFWFLGPATYVEHRGERPMAVTWRLAHALPGDLFAAFGIAVA
jgi:superfamily II DNA or RNA helicase/HKD family nuclease